MLSLVERQPESGLCIGSFDLISPLLCQMFSYLKTSGDHIFPLSMFESFKGCSAEYREGEAV